MGFANIRKFFLYEDKEILYEYKEILYEYKRGRWQYEKKLNRSQSFVACFRMLILTARSSFHDEGCLSALLYSCGIP